MFHSNRVLKKISIGLAISVALGAAACGGRKVTDTKSVEITVPQDFMDEFDVKDAPEQRKAESAAELEKNSKKKKVKKAEKKKAEPPKPAAFVIPNRRPPSEPIWVGERVVMDVKWLSTRAGEFSLETLPYKYVNDRKVYVFRGAAKTLDLFKLIYKADDWVESFVDYEGWFPYKFVLHGDESKHVRDHLELFDHQKKRQYVHIIDNRIKQNDIEEKKGYEELTPFSQDSLSALYYVRTFKLEPGTDVKFPMTSGGNQWDMEITVIEKEKIDTKMGYMNAIKTKIYTYFKGNLQQSGDTFVWFTDDDRKFPVRFEAKVKIGWITGVAKQIDAGTPP